MSLAKTSSFARYAALVENLRGVVLADLSDEGVWSSIKWLIKRFKYRNLGLVPSIIGRFSDRLSKHLSGNPFVELAPPVEYVNSLVDPLSAVSDLGTEVSELLVYSSVYISGDHRRLEVC